VPGETFLWIAVGLVAVAFLWLAIRQAHLGREAARAAGAPEALALLQREVQAVRETLDRRLGEHAQQAEALSERLGRLQEATGEVARLGREIAELQKVLQPPQMRGSFGERLLKDLLTDVLPAERVRFQYTYPKSGTRVDAAVVLEEGRVLPIDAKFPLESVRRYVELRDAGAPEASAARREVQRRVRTHIDDIAARYLSPDDGAVDVAFMYIPSELVYYEVALRGLDGEEDPLASYALRKGVVLVSPNSMHAYLSLVLLGLKGHRLEARAREILGLLAHLRSDLAAFRGEFDTALTQARRSLNNLEDADRALRRVEARLDAVESAGEGEEAEGGEAGA
jgi:DNA recombination protein RmuC